MKSGTVIKQGSLLDNIDSKTKELFHYPKDTGHMISYAVQKPDLLKNDKHMLSNDLECDVIIENAIFNRDT